MEGRGVTNYAVDRPSYSISAATTEFDEALIRRKVITRQDALVAKGASRQQAQQLLNNDVETKQQQFSNQRGAETTTTTTTTSLLPQASLPSGDSEEESSDDEEFVDDELLQRYRAQRLEEIQDQSYKLQREGKVEFGEAVHIARPEWTRQVNEDSERAWVVVCLTSSDTERTGSVELACRLLAPEYRQTKFVLIPSHSAISNWPDQNLPSLFLYRHGKMQHQLVQLKPDLTVEQLARTLTELSVLNNNER